MPRNEEWLVSDVRNLDKDTPDEQELFEALDEHFRLPRERFQQIIAYRQALGSILAEGAERVRAIGEPILRRVRRAVGVGTMIGQR